MVANIFAYLYHLLVGRILGPDRYGELAALLALIYILNVPSQWLQTVMTKYFSSLRANKATGEVKNLFFTATRLTSFFAAFGLVILLPFIKIVAGFLHISSQSDFIWLYFIFAFYLISVIQLSIYQAYQLFLQSNILTNIGAFLRLVLGAIGASFGVTMTLFSNVFSNMIMYLVSFIPLRFVMTAKSQPVSLNKRQIVGYSVPTLLATLGIIALYTQDVILVKHFFSAKDAGIYSSLSILGKVIFYASSAISFVLFPVVAERSALGKDHQKIVFMALTVIAAVSLVLTVGYFVFPGLVVNLLFGPAYSSAAPYLGFFGLFITFYSLASLLTNVTLASGRTSVWWLTGGIALLQTIFISLYHATLLTVIQVNLGLTAILFILLLLYYQYASKRS